MIIRMARKARIVAAAAVASATLGLMGSNVAHADSNLESSSVKVGFADLDLNTPKGSKLLYIRLQNAAETVCGNRFETVNLTERHEIWQCQQQAIESAVARVDMPLLTALYDRHFRAEPLDAAARVSFAPGEVSAPVRVEIVNVAAHRG